MTEGRGKAGKEKDTEMSEECTHDCSTCGKSCGDRKQKFDFSAELVEIPAFEEFAAKVVG